MTQAYSVVAPFVPDELKAERVLQAVAVHFFTRILRGELVVEVVGPGIGSVILDKQEIQNACNRITWDGPKRTKRHLPPPISFANRCIRSKPAVSTQLLGKERLPDLNDEWFSKEELPRLRHQFSSGELTSIGSSCGCLAAKDQARTDKWMSISSD